ncbi:MULTISPECIES: GNAT family N-acetyltransferase [Clostridium]|nr:MULTISPECIES: GNAT family N-acetyltransferase [Clostridium]
MDDSELVAYIHYVFVNPKYQGKEIVKQMIEKIKEKYKKFLYY